MTDSSKSLALLCCWQTTLNGRVKRHEVCGRRLSMKRKSIMATSLTGNLLIAIIVE
jgi:hypothetical protein